MVPSNSVEYINPIIIGDNSGRGSSDDSDQFKNKIMPKNIKSGFGQTRPGQDSSGTDSEEFSGSSTGRDPIMGENDSPLSPRIKKILGPGEGHGKSSHYSKNQENEKNSDNKTGGSKGKASYIKIDSSGGHGVFEANSDIWQLKKTLIKKQPFPPALNFQPLRKRSDSREDPFLLNVLGPMTPDRSKSGNRSSHSSNSDVVQDLSCLVPKSRVKKGQPSISEMTFQPKASIDQPVNEENTLKVNMRRRNLASVDNMGSQSGSEKPNFNLNLAQTVTNLDFDQSTNRDKEFQPPPTYRDRGKYLENDSKRRASCPNSPGRERDRGTRGSSTDPLNKKIFIGQKDFGKTGNIFAKNGQAQIFNQGKGQRLRVQFSNKRKSLSIPKKSGELPSDNIGFKAFIQKGKIGSGDKKIWRKNIAENLKKYGDARLDPPRAADGLAKSSILTGGGGLNMGESTNWDDDRNGARGLFQKVGKSSKVPKIKGIKNSSMVIASRDEKMLKIYGVNK